MDTAVDSRPMIVQARHLTKHARGPDTLVRILEDVSLAIAENETVAVLGPSGSGKSTLLALLAGLDEPTAGEVWLDGTALSGLDEDGRAKLRAGRVGFVFQSFQLLPGFNALENVMLALELAGNADAERQAAGILGRVGLAERVHHYPQQLSGGEQQRVAIARAYAGRPRILFADEPTGNLDRATGAQIIELLFELNAEAGTALVLVTHDEALAERCAQQLRLEAGRIVEPAC